MYQGLLGTFPFTVTELEVSTFRDLKFSREQVYAEHRVLAGIPCLQHMGRNLDPVSLTVQIVPLTPVSTVGLRLRLLESVAAGGDEMAWSSASSITACMCSNPTRSPTASCTTA